MSRCFRTSECDQRPTWVRRLGDILADAKVGGRYWRGTAFDDRWRLSSGSRRLWSHPLTHGIEHIALIENTQAGNSQ